MSNLAKDWQEGSYTVRVTGNLVEASKVHKDTVDGHVCYKKSSTQAKCNPEDEFSLSMGVALAIERLNKELNKGKLWAGDKVRIKRSGLSYITYANWIKKNIDDVGLAACYSFGQTPKEDDTVYIVKAIAPWGIEHEGDKMLAYVQKYFVFNNGKVDDNEPCYLMAIDGLEKV